MTRSLLSAWLVPKPAVFFYHLPKTAGTSLRAVLDAAFEPKAICPAHNWTGLLSASRTDLRRYRLVAGHFYGGLEPRMNARCFAFTFLRDPVDRALSHYGHVLHDSRHYLHRRALELGSIDAYLADPETRMTISNFQARMLAWQGDPEAMFSGLSEEERRAEVLERRMELGDSAMSERDILAAAMARIGRMDMAGLTERFDESLAVLCHALGWPYPRNLRRENVGRSGLKRADLPTSTLRALEACNQLDLELCEHACRLLEKRVNEMFADLLRPRLFGVRMNPGKGK
jgi:hypothetical protein